MYKLKAPIWGYFSSFLGTYHKSSSSFSNTLLVRKAVFLCSIFHKCKLFSFEHPPEKEDCENENKDCKENSQEETEYKHILSLLSSLFIIIQQKTASVKAVTVKKGVEVRGYMPSKH